MGREAAEQVPVKVIVRTTILQGNEQETFELTTFGRYYKKGQATYLLYEEVLEVGHVKTTVKFSTDEAVILRSGALNMRLSFKNQYQMKGHYDSPYGSMDAMTDTKKIEHRQANEKEGVLNLVYELTMQGDVAGIYHMEIKYKEDKK
ncbi:DUF1934 domain-containing protein [Bacillus sp. CGMCC 1.16607]|uniref:DUF1934 domain-containing protein n=1 Tax=Bacillus sp. CGMCC 1.16607 TaxID=3351842 RepID=UPI00362D1D03